MNGQRTVWLAASLFVTVHLVISTVAVIAGAIGQVPEWGMPLGACLTILPLAGLYDGLLDRPHIPLGIQVAVPIIVNGIIYFAVGAGVGALFHRLRMLSKLTR